MIAWHSHIWRGDKLVEWESRVWDADDDARLTLLWAEGMSTVQIGLRIERTKSAVIGRARRLGLLPRPSPLPGSPKPRAVQVAPRAPQTSSPESPPRVVPPHPPAEPSRLPEILPPAARTPNPPTPRPVAFSILKTCQWTDCDGPPWLMCEAPTVEHGPWCAEHRKRCWASNPRALAA